MGSIIETVKRKEVKTDMRKKKKEELIFLTAIINMVTAVILLIKAINS